MDERVAVATALATKWHHGEYRKYTDDEPYIVHPLAVAALVSEVSGRWELVAAALLHDVLECGDEVRQCREEVIRLRLGQAVLDLVLEVTNPSKPEDGDRPTRKAIDRQHLSKASPDGQTLRLADAVDNLSNLAERNPKFALTYAKEKQLILPLTLGGSPLLHARLKAAIDAILAQ
ncbi:HD domain-containing protein [Pseudomonas guariconensis]|uniref:HD domain-containing protein n=1 Tax=Pseudomonas guariconensis TaxID=1288410 RepID=UPI0039063FE7